MESSWWTDPSDLDVDQKKIINLSVAKDHLVLGPPGCGKTNILLLRASFLHRRGTKDIIILSFGRVLREFLASGSANYPFASDKVQTYVRWGINLIKSNGIDFEESMDFEETRSRLYENLLKVAGKNLAENVHDVILLDECQDYSAEEIDIIRKFSRRIFAVGDANQQITDKKGALDHLSSLGVVRTKLTTHYRNGLKICRVADGVKNLLDDPHGLEASSNYDESKFPSTVDVFGNLNLEEQIQHLIPRVETQLQAYPNEMIGIFCPRVGDLDAAKDMLLSSSLAGNLHVQRSGAYSPFSPDRLVVLSTAIGAKGLEFRAVHILAAEALKNFQVQRNLTYTAVTRTKTSLSVYHKGSLAGYFERGIHACNPEKTKDPTLDELFR